ncbi:MAG: TIGR01777 family oxidoreductase, partial [Bdellovibrionales bacterium]|nr:TIGR01777 family oxidoreductase [Bdellovibrionales bacterium]
RKVSDKPKTFISASATGYYGDRGAEELSESSSAGNMFVSQVAKEWEEEAAKASELGIRTVIPRIGIVLTPEGGALRKMLPAFSAGVAGPLGSGAQWMSCIGIDDLIYAIQFLLEQERSEGAYNLTCPEPLTNATFTKALGTVVRRPTVIPVPEFALNLAFGEMAEELLLASVKALPHRLLEEGFTFSFPTVMSTLKFVLGRQL